MIYIMLGDEEKKTLDFKAKGPVPIFLEDERADHRPGCSILDVSFSEPVMIGEIRFRNYYTAYLSMSCKKVPAEKDVKNRDILPWQTSIRNLSLMPDPHCEQCSQDIISIPSKESVIPWSGVVQLRIILKQPSSQWRKFGIEDLTIYKDLQKEEKHFHSHGTSSARKYEPKTSTVDQDKSESSETSKTQNFWTVADLMRDKQTTGAAVGRFEIDGSYDISHLI